MSKMPSIEQFRHIVKSVRKTTQFQGYDTDDNPIMDRNVKYPILTANGTCKVHGTNASVKYTPTLGLVCQSKKHTITPEKDNAGFAQFVHARKNFFEDLMNNIFNYFCTPDDKDVTLFGEFAGKGIQKGVAVAELEKSFFVFGVRIKDKEGVSRWATDNQFDGFFGLNDEAKIHDGVYNLRMIKTYQVEVDFNNPELANNTFADIVDEIEKECPVGKFFGVSGLGEGVVFKFEYKGNIYLYKCKGEKHSKSKVKKVKKVDTEKITKAMGIADKVTPNWRLEQIFNETFDVINKGHDEVSIKRTGEYIKNVIADVVKEDLDIITDAGLEMKDVGKYISGNAKDYLFAILDKDAGL